MTSFKIVDPDDNGWKSWLQGAPVEGRPLSRRFEGWEGKFPSGVPVAVELHYVVNGQGSALNPYVIVTLIPEPESDVEGGTDERS